LDSASFTATLARQVKAERLRRSFALFVREFWPVLEPEKALAWGIHLDAVCLHLQAVAEGRIQKLLIEIPPGHAKSIVGAAMFPAWMWARRPGWRVLYASYAAGLSTRDSRRTRLLITSQEYQSTFRPAWVLTSDQNVKSYFENSAGGFRMALGARGQGTGYRGDAVFVDDALSAEQAESQTERDRVARYYDKTLTSRLNDKAIGVQIVIGQRLHLWDLAGHLSQKEGWTILRLATEFDPDDRCETPLWGDPRTEADELLFPALFPREVVDEIKAELGPAGYAAQHQQRPGATVGRRIEAAWLRRYAPADLPREFDVVIQSWDFSHGAKGKRASYCVGQVWGAIGARYFLIWQIRARMGLPEMMDSIRELSSAYPEALQKIVENKAHGRAILDTLADEIDGLVAYDPTGQGDKAARLAAVAPLFRAGNVFIPRDCDAGWVEDYTFEITNFPGAAQYDDQVDATSQALLALRESAVDDHLGNVDY
jgi:predicted phage terminase large subunit-like protein